MKIDKIWFRHEDAVRLGSADKAAILEFVRWSCHYKESEEEPNLKYHMDGHWWMQDSFAAWQKRMPWLSLRTLKSYFNELYDAGYLDKRTVGKSSGGRDANFYRPTDPDDVKCKKCHEKLSADSALVECKSCTRLSAESALSFISTKNLSKNQTRNPASGEAPNIAVATKMTEWEASDELAPVFENLNKLPACKRQFHREKYRLWLKELMQEQATTIEVLIKESEKWQKHHNLPGGKRPTKISSSFGNWIKNHFAWGKDQENGNFRRVSKEQRMGEQGYDPFSDADFVSKINAVPT